MWYVTYESDGTRKTEFCADAIEYLTFCQFLKMMGVHHDSWKVDSD